MLSTDACAAHIDKAQTKSIGTPGLMISLEGITKSGSDTDGILQAFERLLPDP